MVFGLTIFWNLDRSPKYPAVNLQTCCEAAGHYDAESAQQMQQDSGALKQQSRELVKESLKQTSNEKLSEAQLNQLADAVLELQQKLTISTELVTKDREKARVKVTMQSVDFGKMVREARKEIIRRSDTVGGQPQKEMAVYVQALLLSLQQAEAQEERVFSVDCKVDSKLGMWVPEDPKAFHQELFAKMLYTGR